MLLDNKICNNNNYTTVAATTLALAPLRPVSVGRMDVLQIKIPVLMQIHHHTVEVK